MERAIKPQNNFSRNIAEAKSKLRCEHHRLSHRRIGKRLFSAPAHEWQFNPGQRLLAITIWKSSEEASDCGRFAGRQAGNLPTQYAGSSETEHKRGRRRICAEISDQCAGVRQNFFAFFADRDRSRL